MTASAKQTRHRQSGNHFQKHGASSKIFVVEFYAGLIPSAKSMRADVFCTDMCRGYGDTRTPRFGSAPGGREASRERDLAHSGTTHLRG